MAETCAEDLHRLLPGWRIEAGLKGTNSAGWIIHLALPGAKSAPVTGRRILQQVGRARNDAYALKSWSQKGRCHLLIGGNVKRSVFFGFYDYLRRVFGVFYDFHADLRPRGPSVSAPIPRNLEVVAESAVSFRSYKPQMLGNYSDRHSPWAWDAARWEQCVRWCVRQRYNALHLNFFAEANYLRFKCALEAQAVADPYMSTATRIAMMQKVIHRCHDYGLKVLVGFCSNGSTFAYANAHPDQKTTANSPYQGYLCWHKGHDHLLAVAKEFIDTYREADGFVLWPHEGLCRCEHCQDGRSFLRLIREVGADLKQRYPEKEYHLLDWHFPTRDFLQQFRAELPAGMTIFNVHGETGIFAALAAKLPVIHQACVANWDGSNATIMSPNLPEMAFRVKAWADKVVGFEAHHVSMFGGEYTIDGFGDLIWDPPAFSETLYRQEYVGAVFGEQDRAALEEIYRLLECPWTSPFHNYCGLPLYDALSGAEIEQNKIGGINYHYELKDGFVQLAGGPADTMTAANMLCMAVAALTQADLLARGLRIKGPYATFLKANVAIQKHYAVWIERKYEALLLAREALDQAERKDWPRARALMTLALEIFETGALALDEACRVAVRYPEYFHVIRGYSNRGWECQLSDLGLKIRRGLFYGASISPNSAGRNLGKLGYRRLLKHIASRLERRQQVPSLTAMVGAMQKE